MMKPTRGKKGQGIDPNLKLPVVFCLCLCFFLAGLFGSNLLSKDVNRGLSRHESMEETAHEGGDPIFHGESGEPSLSSIPFQVLSWKPRAVYFPNFATAEQCQTVIKIAKGKLRPSGLALRQGETAASTKGVRTSLIPHLLIEIRVYSPSHVTRHPCEELMEGTFLSASEDRSGVLEFVERKIARATMLPRNHGEAFNVLRYEIGQRYVSHYDSFNPAEYGPMKSQRVASFLLYLSDVEEGGETMFPFENGANMNTGYDYESCIGLKVKPRQGDGVLFYSLSPNGTIDKTSLHGSCPVVKGEKWVATKWIRDDVH